MRRTDILTKKGIVAALVTGVVPLAVFAAGYAASGGTTSDVLVAGAFILAAALLAGLMFAFGRKFWFTGIVMGIVIGTFFAADLLFEEHFEQQFIIATATYMFFVALGFMLGAIAELIHLLHHAVHRGNIEHCITEPDELAVAEK